MIASILLALYLLGIVTAPAAASFLFVSGAILLISELVFTSGILALNGLLALYVAYTLKYGESMVFGQAIGWDVLFGIAFVEVVILVALVVIVLRQRKQKLTTGKESMIGQRAEVIEWSGKKGLVRIHGESWKAQSEQEWLLVPGDHALITHVNGLTLTITIYN